MIRAAQHSSDCQLLAAWAGDNPPELGEIGPNYTDWAAQFQAMGHRIHEGMGHTDTDRNKSGKEISTRNLNTFITIFYLDY